MSEIFTHRAPALLVPESWTAEPAGVFTEPPDSTAHDDPLCVPTPSPIVIVDGGPAAVSVTSTRPVAAIVKLLKALPRTGTVPENVSVVRVTVGVVVVVVATAGVELPVHDADPRATTASAAMRAVAEEILTNASA